MPPGDSVRKEESSTNGLSQHYSYFVLQEQHKVATVGDLSPCLSINFLKCPMYRK